MKAGAMEGRREPALVSVGRSYVWNCCGSAWDGWWEAPTAPFWGSGSSQGAGFLQAPGAVPHLLLHPPWVSRCCNPSASARPRPVNSQINVPVIGVETSCGHLGKSELYSLSTFLMAQPISATVGKYRTRGPCIYSSQREKTCFCGRRGGEGCCCIAFPVWEKKIKPNILIFLDPTKQPCVLDTRTFSGRLHQPHDECETPQGGRRPILSH